MRVYTVLIIQISWQMAYTPLKKFYSVVLTFRYIDDTMIKLLNISQHCYQDHYSNPVLSKSPIFKNRRLIDVAGELEYETFFSQTIARRIVAYEWRQV